MKRILKITAMILGIGLLCGGAYGYHYLSSIAPIATGYTAKILCSSVYVSGRTVDSIMAEDLENTGDFLVKTHLMAKDRGAEATLLGLFKSRAIYREGLGCTLVNGVEASALKRQSREFKPMPAGGPLVPSAFL